MTHISKWISRLMLAAFCAGTLATSAVAGEMMASSKKMVEMPIEEPEPWLSGAISVGYDSIYMFRGVEIFGETGPADNLVWTDVNFSAYGFNLGAWYASSASGSEFNELDLYASYTYEIGNFGITGGGIYYHFPFDDSFNTWELFVGLDYQIVDWLAASLYYYYDFDAFEGGYLELQLSSSIPLYTKGEDVVLSFDPYVLLAYDNEYNSGGNELNHFQVGAALTYNFLERCSLSAYIAYSEPLSAIDDFQDNEVWGGGSFSVSF